MKALKLLAICLVVSSTIIQGQDKSGPDNFLPKPTAKGIGKINTRIDNMGYWRRMADSGFVQVAPYDNVPQAFFTGSRIENPMVMTTNSTDVPVAPASSTQSENSVFVDPADNLSVLNSNNSTTNPVGSLYGADYLLSNDGSATWGGSVTGAGGGNSGDPTTAIGLSGRRYIGFIDNASGQSVAYSDDEGSTWTAVVAGVQNGDLLDKNHMWIDNSSTSAYEGYVYSSWTDFGATGSPIEITRSTNDGISYSTPLAISAGVTAGSHCQGVNIQTGPGGEVYVIWAIYDSWPSDETAIGMAKSTNGGASYATATRIISNIRGIRNTTAGKNHRVNSFPSMAVDISGGPRNGYIYIVWANVGVPGTNTGSDVDVYMICSTNGGTNWSTPIRVNQDTQGLGKKHYFPWITCDPVTGDLSVIFYDDRNVSSTQCEVYCASSFNGGDTWTDFKVSDVAFTPAAIPGLAGGYMGDYLGISARNNKVYPIWPDNRSGSVMSYCSPFDLSPLPDAAFTANTTTPCLGNTVIFTDQTNKSPISWAWTFTPSTVTYMDGTSATSQNPHVRFDAYGSYNVRLIVNNAVGADTLIKNNYIGVNFANADFIASNLTPIINTAVTFTDQSSCNISSYLWDFGAGATPATATTQGPHNVTYASTGSKTISLTINGNVTKTKTNYIEVLPEIYNMSNTTLAVCSGTFYDPQGTSNYLDNLNYTMTFLPGQANKVIQMAFSAFELESHSSCGYDYLKIYNGPDISGALIGTYCGTTSPGTVASSHATGALTFVFHSDASVTRPGWVATVSCIDAPPPSYCPAGATTCDEYISRVVYGSVDNSTGCTAGGYNNFSSMFIKASPTYTYPVTVTNGNLNWPADQCGIWIDWNHDYDFDDAGESITVSGTPGIGPYTASIVPPANAVKGMTRMRIRITYTGTVSPCGTTAYGEVEDYSVYVGTPGLWSGGTVGSGTDWYNANNWDDGLVPTATQSVVIPDGAVSYPVLAGTITSLNVEIKNGGNMSIPAGATYNIAGNLTVGQGVSGILTVNGGVCNVTGNVTTQAGGKIEVKNGGIMNDNN